MNIVVNSIGKASTNWHKEALAMYAQRITTMARLTEHCMMTPKRAKHTSIEKLKAQEQAFLIAHIPKGAHVILLDERGSTHATQAYANQLKQYQAHHQTLCFLLGGPDGHSASIHKYAHSKLALSEFTMPHILAKIMLYEQLYRCMTLMKKHPYHR